MADDKGAVDDPPLKGFDAFKVEQKVMLISYFTKKVKYKLLVSH